MADWLNLQLERELRPVLAPDELWGRVQAARRPAARPNPWRALRLPIFAGAALVLAAAVLTSFPRPAFERLAARELTRRAPLELRSSNPAEIRAWLRRETGVDVAIPPSGRVRLEGARVIRDRGASIGAVAYRTGGGEALLLVAQSGGVFRAPTRHGGASWQQHRQVYAIACSAPERQSACLLCHASL